MTKTDMALAYARFLVLKMKYAGRLVSAGRNFFWPGDFVLSRRGRMELGRGNGFMKGYDIELVGSGRVVIGDRNFFNRNAKIACLQKIEIGNGCAFGDSVQFYDHDHQFSGDQKGFREQGYQSAPIVVRDNVWIGARAIILKGVEIGANSVVGAGAVVTRSVPPDSVVAGVPAKVIRKRSSA